MQSIRFSAAGRVVECSRSVDPASLVGILGANSLCLDRKGYRTTHQEDGTSKGPTDNIPVPKHPSPIRDMVTCEQSDLTKTITSSTRERALPGTAS